MEAFQLLSRGGAKFNKTKFAKDIQLFDKSTAKPSASSEVVDPSPTNSFALPGELDFFKYAQGSHEKRKSNPAQSSKRPSKRRKLEDDEDQDSSDPESAAGMDDEEVEELPPAFRHRIKTTGEDIPDYIKSFAELTERYNISPKLLANLSRHGFKEPTGIQAYGVPSLLENRDLAAISPTGTGKTLAYLLPLFASLQAPVTQRDDAGAGIRAIIVAPTRELAHQIHNEALKLAEGRKWRIVLFSKATANALNDKAAQDKTDIVVSTPLRLVSSLQSGNLKLDNVRHLVLDEADRMLDAEFLPQIQEIISSCTYSHVQKAVFSATLPAGPEALALNMMHRPIRAVVGLKDTPLPHITQLLTYTATDSMKLPTLISYLKNPFNPPMLIFTSTQPRAASLAEELILQGIQNVGSLHAGMTNKARDDTISGMRNGTCWILVCTEVAGRGLDFKGVREVINYDFPRSVQSYVHRIGRTGRAGREGKAITYFTDEDAPYLKAIANVLLQSGCPVPEWITKLPKPSKLKRKQMGKTQRPEQVNNARLIAKKHAVKKREMIEGSKRRAAKAETESTGRTGDKTQ